MLLKGAAYVRVSETADPADGRRCAAGRAAPVRTAENHFVNGRRLTPPFPEGIETAMFGLGCFWGAERKFWQIDGVYVTAVGFAGGLTPNPTYEEVCSGLTGHNEVVLVAFDPAKISYEALLKVFWESHDPTQGMRQGADVGTQYRSGIYVANAAQRAVAEASKAAFAKVLAEKGLARSRRRFSTARPSITPRAITSNISPKIPMAIAASAAPASPVRSASPPDRRGAIAARAIIRDGIEATLARSGVIPRRDRVPRLEHAMRFHQRLGSLSPVCWPSAPRAGFSGMLRPTRRRRTRNRARRPRPLGKAAGDTL